MLSKCWKNLKTAPFYQFVEKNIEYILNVRKIRFFSTYVTYLPSTFKLKKRNSKFHFLREIYIYIDGHIRFWDSINLYILMTEKLSDKYCPTDQDYEICVKNVVFLKKIILKHYKFYKIN